MKSSFLCFLSLCVCSCLPVFCVCHVVTAAEPGFVPLSQDLRLLLLGSSPPLTLW